MTKNYFYFFLLLASFCVLSCNNSDDEPQKGDPQGDCFTAKIDGELFEGDNVSGTFTNGGGFTFMTIGATVTNADLPTFGMTIFAATEGTYDIVAQNGTDVGVTYSPSTLNSTLIFGGTSGSLTITEWDTSDKRISGTFNFEGTGDGETIQVTEGFFDIGYQ